MGGPVSLKAEHIASRFQDAARQGRDHAEEIVAGCIDGVPVERVEVALHALGVFCHRERLRLHYRAPGELPRLVLG